MKDEFWFIYFFYLGGRPIKKAVYSHTDGYFFFGKIYETQTKVSLVGKNMLDRYCMVFWFYGMMNVWETLKCKCDNGISV